MKDRACCFPTTSTYLIFLNAYVRVFFIIKINLLHYTLVHMALNVQLDTPS